MKTTSSRFIVILLAGLMTASLGCEEKKKQKPKPEPEPVEKTEEEKKEEEKIAKAKEKAEEEAEDLVVAISDNARWMSAGLEADQKKTKNSPGPSAAPERKAQPKNGQVDVAAVKKVFGRHKSEMQKCYERALKRNPSLAGKTFLKVIIDGDGKAHSVSAGGGSLNDDQVANCMEERAQSWSFPKARGGLATVRMPYSFAPDM